MCNVLIASREEEPKKVMEMPGVPYQGGYPDFMRYEDLNDACSTPGPSRESMLEDICYYWENHGKQIIVEDDPVVATFFLKKIIASNYLLLIGYISAGIGELDYHISRRDRPISNLNIEWVEERWKDLQAWNRQCSRYCESVEDMLDSFGVLSVKSEVLHSWETSNKDFYIIQRKLLNIKHRSNDMLTSFTGLAGILGNRQSLHEAKSVKILTFLGIIFLPLSLTSGLLTMNEEYQPGASHFWIYFAIAIPLILSVFGVVFLVDTGLDGKWFLRHRTTQTAGLKENKEKVVGA